MSVSENIQNLVEMKKELDPLIAKMRDLEKKVKAELIESGKDEVEKVLVGGVDITWKSEYIRTTWNSKQLEELALIIPEVLDCKKTSTVKETVAFKFL